MIIQTHNLGKNYGKHIGVKDINLNIQEGCIYGLVGRNGAGKTTLMRMLAGISKPTTGEIVVSTNGFEKIESMQNIGALIENPAIYPNLSAYENLKIKCLAYGVENLQEHIIQILKIVGLSEVSDKKTRKISLGMKQRLGIGMALVGFPKILILDEPINGLDPQGIIDIRNALISINSEYKMTMIISSHILEELAKIANIFGIIDEGRVVAEMTSSQLHEQCRSCIEVKVSDVESACLILEKNEYTLREIRDDYIYFSEDYIGKEWKINDILVKSGIKVYSLRIREKSFENFFIEVTQREKISQS